LCGLRPFQVLDFGLNLLDLRIVDLGRLLGGTAGLSDCLRVADLRAQMAYFDLLLLDDPVEPVEPCADAICCFVAMLRRQILRNRLRSKQCSNGSARE
jgi:hypothetical protein